MPLLFAFFFPLIHRILLILLFARRIVLLRVIGVVIRCTLPRLLLVVVSLCFSVFSTLLRFLFLLPLLPLACESRAVVGDDAVRGRARRPTSEQGERAAAPQWPERPNIHSTSRPRPPPPAPRMPSAEPWRQSLAPNSPQCETPLGD